MLSLIISLLLSLNLIGSEADFGNLSAEEQQELIIIVTDETL